MIVVTTTADVTDGDLSSAAALAARPGGEGVSLREALDVTNGAPGIYTIKFASRLKDASITIGAGGGQKLNHMTGGNVFINGDIDADGRSDVTLKAGGEFVEGIPVASSGNRIHALTIEGFRQGVVIAPQGKGVTLTGNVVSNSVFRRVTEGVLLAGKAIHDGKVVFASTENKWTNTRVIGNTIEASAQGVGVFLPSRGDQAVGIIVAKNTIRIGSAANANGIQLSSGFRGGSTNNLTKTVLIAENSIEAPVAPADLPMVGIWLQTGTQGASDNVLEDVLVVANRVQLPTTRLTTGIELIVADAATDDYDRSIQPILFPENNIMSDVRIQANTVVGPGRRGVIATAGCCGARANVIDRVTIEGNVIDSHMAPGSDGAIAIWAGNSGNFFVRPTEGSVVQSARIARNTLRYHSTGSGADVSSGAIVVVAGNEASKSGIEGMTVTSNSIETDAIGISILGARGSGRYPTTGNWVRSVTLSCNHVQNGPSLGGLSGLRGIALIGGLGPSSGNTVEATLTDNLVAGRMDDVSVIDNRDGATGNTATRR